MTEVLPMVDPEQPVPAPGTDQIALVNLFLTQLHQVELRIGKKIDDNSSAATDRWKTHDAEHHELAEAVRKIGDRLNKHLDDEKEDDIRMEARLGPVKGAGRWVVREWRTLVIVGFLALDFLASIQDLAGGLFGHH